MKSMKYRPKCPAALNHARKNSAWKGNGRPPTAVLCPHTQAANMAALELIHAEASVWQWHLHSLSKSFLLPTCMGTHTEAKALGGGVVLGHEKAFLPAAGRSGV